MYLMQHGMLPRPDAVRIEELVNYFTYDYAPPKDDLPFAAHLEVAECPWAPAHRLVRVGIKGKEIERDKRPTSNLVFLLDVSGSMNQPNKLPLVKHGMKMLVDQLGENDRVAIVVYAGAAGMVLDSTTGDQKQVLLDALDRLQAGGSTNGGQGIQLAYQTALDRFIRGGVNRVILCTDGDFNVGVTGTDQLVRMAEQNAKSGVFLSVLGFGMGNHNDAMLEQLSDKGNGNYAFIDTEAEARKVLVEQMTGTLVTIAKDVKIQVEFNPQQVAAYRLIGYENRILAAQDFNDDKKDAGEIGAGHTVTALYEIVPSGVAGSVTVPPVDDLRYQTQGQPSEAAQSGEWLTLKMRFKLPEGDTSTKLEFPLRDAGLRFGQASQDFRFAAAVAAFGMLLRDSQFKGNATYAGVLEIAKEAASGDTTGYRDGFLGLVAKAKQLSGQ
jgi:Ca-activated chloride channel family protein